MTWTPTAAGTDVEAGASRRDVPWQRLGGVAGAALAPVFIGVLVVLTVVQLEFLRDSGWTPLGVDGPPYPSWTARGPHGWVQTTNFAVAGVLALTFLRGLAPVLRGGWGWVARGLLALVGCSFLLAVAPVDPVGGPTTTLGVLHLVGYVGLLAGLGFGIPATGLALRRSAAAGWRRWGTVSLLAGLVLLAVLVGGSVVPNALPSYAWMAGSLAWYGLTGLRLVREASRR